MQLLAVEGIDSAKLTVAQFSPPEGTGEGISRRLKESPFAAVRCLQSEFRDGTLILAGRVPTYYTKQIAISLACNFPGVELVVDRIEVHRPAYQT